MNGTLGDHFRFIDYIPRFCYDERLHSFRHYCNNRFNFRKNSRPGGTKCGNRYIHKDHTLSSTEESIKLTMSSI